MAKERLQRILARCGIDSRRNCEQLILEGVITVNGQTVDTLPAFADAAADVIKVNGRRIKEQSKEYYLLNKPKGVLCTSRDPSGRKKAVDFIDTPSRIFCVGRLDADTTGAIILTNDSELADKLTHPRHRMLKTYIVEVKGKFMPEAVARLKKGVWLAEGRTLPARVKILKSHYSRSIIEISISQGLNRQIRRVFVKLGYKVNSLKRIAIGTVSLRRLAPGRYRTLTIVEVNSLKKSGRDF